MFKKASKENMKRFLITLTNPKSPFAEQYRTVRTNIQFSAIDTTLKTLLVTSSEPSEGKTTTIANLAVTYAQQGKKVLLVDADLRKPQIHVVFKLENFKGLSSVIVQGKSLSDVTQSSKVDNLSILTSGPIPPNPSELLSSVKMKNLVAQMTEEYDVVLFDAPPVLAVTDAQIVSQICDGTILVVRSGYTAKEKVKKSKELLTLVNAKILGTILNRAEQNKDNYYYYYGNEE
ncbi:CpsD/CapB family tyrosine-protein kinase [Gottfriedia luciferensis]|uniref:CpsD/CapB family tyrosine-protein kinase n=1 Tax=Gottfriedia luciferensis TaxID=178774 RepID=UPI000B436F24|nr:CpsD/CapB family tyrosine-protein kinase [Gottfriedia luciferensis]